jgi:hypothetical protein
MRSTSVSYCRSLPTRMQQARVWRLRKAPTWARIFRTVELPKIDRARAPRRRHRRQTRAIDVHAKVFAALRELGFREREVRTVLEELRQEADLLGANTAGLLREALRRIRLAPR